MKKYIYNNGLNTCCVFCNFIFCVYVYVYVADSTLSPHAHAGLEIVETSKFGVSLTLQFFCSENSFYAKKKITLNQQEG